MIFFINYITIMNDAHDLRFYFFLLSYSLVINKMVLYLIILSVSEMYDVSRYDLCHTISILFSGFFFYILCGGTNEHSIATDPVL